MAHQVWLQLNPSVPPPGRELRGGGKLWAVPKWCGETPCLREAEPILVQAFQDDRVRDEQTQLTRCQCRRQQHGSLRATRPEGVGTPELTRAVVSSLPPAKPEGWGEETSPSLLSFWLRPSICLGKQRKGQVLSWPLYLTQPHLG